MQNLQNKINSHFKNNSTFIKPVLFLFLLLIFDGLFLISCDNLHSKNRNEKLSSKDEIEYGKYLVKIAGCNDCHTPGYVENNAKIPVKEWLSGSPVGFKGPWGTSYASNLRLFVQNLNEEQWLEMAHSRNGMPPMPWVSLQAMNDDDLLAIYRFIKSLGPNGKMAPTYVGPTQEPNTPYIIFEPLHMERLTQNKN